MEIDLRLMAISYFELAEETFGPSVSEWTFGGVEINDCPPHVAYYPDQKAVCVSLSKKTLDNETQLLFQLSHEICHCLYPSMDIQTRNLEKVNFLNEGISTHFSVSCLSRFLDVNPILDDLERNSSNYFRALSLVNSLLSYHDRAIVMVRKIQPYVNRLTLNDFKNAGLLFPKILVEELLSEFK